MDFYNILEEYIAPEHVAEPRAPREFKDRINFGSNVDFVQRFRLREDTASYLVRRIGHRLQHSSQRNMALNPREQVLLSLRFLSTDGFYHLIRDAHGPSESTVCRTVKRVVQAINETLFDELVQWPEDCTHFAQQFFLMGGMPSVCGLIDGTLINIKTPTAHEEQFVDRKGNHSLNVLVAVGPQCQFLYCNPNWPGSVNDARVLRNSNLYTSFNLRNFRPFPGAVLLGDSIYPCTDWLIPPLLGEQPEGPTKKFNKAHKKTRSTVERAIGILRMRFNCLTYLRVRGAHDAAEIVKACVTIHNLCILREGAPDEQALLAMDQVFVPPDNQDDEEGAEEQPVQRNQLRRQQLIQFFAN